MPRSIVLLLAVCCAVPLQAQTLYVTDRLAIAVHERPGRDAPVLTVVTSDTPVERLTRQGAFSRVRLPDDTTGWVEDIYLSPTPTAAVRLAALRAQPPVAPPPPARGGRGGLIAGIIAALALGAGGFAAGHALRVRHERKRLHGLRL